MIDPELRDLFGHTVQLQHWIKHNANGEAEYGPPEFWAAEISGRNRMVRNAQGQEVVASLTVTLYGAPHDISPKDRVVLPEDYSPRRPPILSVEKYHDENGPHSTVILLQ